MRILFSLMLPLIVSACINKNDVPQNIIKPQKMQKVMMDMLLADAVNSEMSSRDTNFKLTAQNKYRFEQIFKNHKISKDQFYKSYNYYLSHPDIFKPITDSIASISERIRTVELRVDTHQTKPNGNNIKHIAKPVRNRR